MMSSVGVAGVIRDKVTPDYKKVPNPNLQKYIPSFKIIPPIFFTSYAESQILEFLEGRDGRMVD